MQFGWWNGSAPVTTNSSDILATAYVKHGDATLIAIASWSGKTESIYLDIDFAAFLEKAETSVEEVMFLGDWVGRMHESMEGGDEDFLNLSSSKMKWLISL